MLNSCVCVCVFPAALGADLKSAALEQVVIHQRNSDLTQLGLFKMLVKKHFANNKLVSECRAVVSGEVIFKETNTLWLSDCYPSLS